ncbi:MAG: hypothetical protein ACJ75N_00405 [Actinomycetes bacterium]
MLRADVTHAFQYISEHNERVWLPAFKDTVRLRFHPLAEVRRNHGPYDLLRALKYTAGFGLGRLRGRRALLDDPYAVFAAPWLARRVGCQVVVTVRDPVATVSSWRRLGWTPRLAELLAQPALVRDCLARFVPDLEAALAADGDGGVGRPPFPHQNGHAFWAALGPQPAVNNRNATTTRGSRGHICPAEQAYSAEHTRPELAVDSLSPRRKSAGGQWTSRVEPASWVAVASRGRTSPK